jgi:hypothetical protein
MSCRNCTRAVCGSHRQLYGIGSQWDCLKPVGLPQQPSVHALGFMLNTAVSPTCGLYPEPVGSAYTGFKGNKEANDDNE